VRWWERLLVIVGLTALFMLLLVMLLEVPK
jgi:hypothetical protein